MECVHRPPKNKAMKCCYPEYSSESLEVFTEDFSEKNSLGYTQFGRLYRAKIEGDKEEVLVKRWYDHRHYGKGGLASDSTIMREIQFLQEHKNFVNVIGYCSSGHEMGIIYDLNPMDSLENLIFKENFSWIDRIKVAYKVAELIDTLHSDLEEPYILRNLDAAHIMIDQDFNPKLIDFTMLSGGIMGDRASQDKYVLVVPGYTAPDYIPGAKTDVYMYGVILLSLIAKRRAFDPKPPNFTAVVDWAREVYDPMQSLVHETLQKESAYVAEDGRAITALAMHCVEKNMTERPTMKEIIQKLENLRCFKSILAQTSSVQSRLGNDGVHGPSISSMSVELSSASAAVDRSNITLGGECMLPNVQDTIFEISPNYVRLTSPIRLLRGLGSGWCAAVNLKSPRREEVVIRKIGNAFDSIIHAKRTLWEIKLLRHMKHDNVIAIKDIIRPPQKETFNDVYIVYDLMGNTLHQKIRSNYLPTDIQCRMFLCQLLRGLKHLHSANVLHCDLRPTNLLLIKNTWNLVIGDSGLARTTSETNSSMTTENVGTRWYWAPELLLKCSEYTAATDIWSVGCIFGEMMTTLPLFPGENSVHQLRLITELIGSPDNSSLGFLQSDEEARKIVSQLPQYPKQQFSDRFGFKAHSCFDLLEKMLVFDPNKRITVDEALCHRYLLPVVNREVHVCPTPFNFNLERPPLTKEDIKELIWEESVKFNHPTDPTN